MSERVECPQCGGDGWYTGHEGSCRGWGGDDCDCSGEQVQCEECNGHGFLLAAPPSPEQEQK